MTKTCTNCNREKPIEAFNRTGRRGTRQSHCYECKKAKLNQRNQERKALLVSMAGGRCIVCGYNRCISALDFHHIGEKTLEISEPGKFKMKIEEIKKCVLLCANCHREAHSCPEFLICVLDHFSK